MLFGLTVWTTGDCFEITTTPDLMWELGWLLSQVPNSWKGPTVIQVKQYYQRRLKAVATIVLACRVPSRDTATLIARYVLMQK